MGEVANFIPQDVEALAAEVAHARVAKHRRPDLLRTFFQHARLDLCGRTVRGFTF